MRYTRQGGKKCQVFGKFCVRAKFMIPYLSHIYTLSYLHTINGSQKGICTILTKLESVFCFLLST